MLKKLSHFIDSPTGGTQNSFTKEKAHLNDSFDFLALIRAWKDIAGAKLSEHTIPLKNQNGVLIVLSNHSAFANELSFMELPLKKKIIAKFPTLEKSILSIKFIVDSTHFSKQYQQFITPIEKKKAQTLHPYSPEFRRLKKIAEELFNDLEDPEVKEKMISLYIQSIK
ncbi:MAG: DUF721 domain-containing protein [Bacteriovorax sp.]|nr:DUF721 domain-containing protein [Bacteriovorax sp.]